MRSFLLLLALRWLPVGLIIPVGLLLPLERGLTLAQAGSVAAVQGLTVLLLELPTGGLTDAIGRRPVLVAAAALSLLSSAVLAVAGSVTLFAVYWLMQGVYRALDSGPLESWFVDQTLAADPGADIETGLSRGGVVIGAAIAGGALLGGGLVALGPIGPVSALTVPVLAGLGVQAGYLIAVLLLMTETRPGRGPGALRASLRAAPAAIAGALRLARTSRVVAALVAVEFLWGFGLVAYEQLTPVRLAELVGGADRASALMGPAGSAAWAASAAGAALAPLLARRIGAARAGFALRIGHGLAVAAMGLLGGVTGLIGAYLVCYVMHGAANPVHAGLLHRQVDGPHRASLVSLNSMAAQPAGSLGMIALTSIAGGAGVRAAMLTGAAVLAVAGPLYLVRARRVPAEVSS